MFCKFTILVLVMFSAIGSAYAQKQTNRVQDEAMIRANVAQMVKGWNAKSGEEFAKPFAEDSDYVVVNGMHVKGRAANAAGHQQIFDTIYKDSDIAAAVEQIRFLRPDVAVVHVLAERFSKSQPEQRFKGRVTLVMVKNKDKWEIAAFQNTQIQMPAGRNQ
jgi:uncharacterized protein (TIGR02246 family)